MSAASQDIAVKNSRTTITLIYVTLLVFALFYLVPLFVMVVNSLKPLSEITGGNMMALPEQWTVEP